MKRASNEKREGAKNLHTLVKAWSFMQALATHYDKIFRMEMPIWNLIFFFFPLLLYPTTIVFEIQVDFKK